MLQLVDSKIHRAKVFLAQLLPALPSIVQITGRTIFISGTIVFAVVPGEDSPFHPLPFFLPLFCVAGERVKSSRNLARQINKRVFYEFWSGKINKASFLNCKTETSYGHNKQQWRRERLRVYRYVERGTSEETDWSYFLQFRWKDTPFVAALIWKF